MVKIFKNRVNGLKVRREKPQDDHWIVSKFDLYLPATPSDSSFARGERASKSLLPFAGGGKLITTQFPLLRKEGKLRGSCCKIEF